MGNAPEGLQELDGGAHAEPAGRGWPAPKEPAIGACIVWDEPGSPRHQLWAAPERLGAR